MEPVDVVLEERYWYPDDGGVVWVAGFHLVDADGRFVGREAALERGRVVTAVAGARHQGDALQGEVGPGTALVLVRDPDNEHDPNAIRVLAAGAQVGWVPREHAARIAVDLDSGRPWSAVVLREQRASPRDPRTGLTMLLVPAPAIELRQGVRHGHRHRPIPPAP